MARVQADRQVPRQGGADRGGQAGPSTADRGGQQSAFGGADRGSAAKTDSSRGQASRESMSAQSSQRGVEVPVVVPAEAAVAVEVPVEAVVVAAVVAAAVEDDREVRI